MRVLLPLLVLWLSSCANALDLEGDFTQGGFVMGETVPGSTVTLNDKELPLTPDGAFIFGFGREAPRNHVLKVQTPEGVVQKKNIGITRRDYNIQRINGLPPNMVNPASSKALRERIQREIKEIKKARAIHTETPYFLSGFIWPASGEITGVYGSQRILNGTPKQPHYGVDIAAKMGAPVKAPADGVVRLVQKDNYYSGGTLLLDHGHGLFSAFLHMNSVDAQVGEQLKQGDVLGTVGSTGRSTGAHLDWRVNWGKERLDAALIAGPMPN